MSYPVWEKRFKALSRKMKSFHGKISNSTHSGVDRIDDLKNLMKCLRIYATGEFEFFRQGFSPNVTLNLTKSNRYPPEHEFRSVINQSYEDVKLYERIFYQRSDNDLKAALSVADKMVWDALQPALNSELFDENEKNPAVITYFHKTAEVRIVSYASVALIGIPFTAIEEPIDFLAIPHEVGHYVFRCASKESKDMNGNSYRRPLRNIIYHKFSGKLIDGNVPQAQRSLKDWPQYLQEWLEEIFADVYGCLIAGPVIALDFQDLQLHFSIKRFPMNDGDHPSPILRPHIYNSVLGGFAKNWADFLDQLWIIRRDDRQSNEPVKDRGQFKTQGGMKIDVNSVNPAVQNPSNPKLKQVIDFILSELGIINPSDAVWWDSFRVPPMPASWNINSVKYKSLTVAEIQDELYKHIQEKFVYDNDENLFDWENSDPNSLSSPPNLGSSSCNIAFDIGKNEVIKNDLNQHLPDWPEAFFPVNPRPVEAYNRYEHVYDSDIDQKIWWVWDILFRSGWNTFGNGDWLKGP